MVSGTIWSLVPPAAAIALALLTKEVYLSLMIGILAGGLLCTGFHPLRAVEVTFGIMGDRMGENINIILFLALLGIIVSLITRSGASKAYGEWASRTIRSSRGALLATAALGAMIFVDDYFNCLTVGTVMRPVTDKYQVTRAKLAYIIDATAAPVCIIAPVSSWAAHPVQEIVNTVVGIRDLAAVIDGLHQLFLRDSLFAPQPHKLQHLNKFQRALAAQQQFLPLAGD